MKISAIFAFVAAIEAGFLHSTTAQDAISVYRTYVTDCSACPSGSFCTNTIAECVSPVESGVCFNPEIDTFQRGCPEGYDCFDGKCECVVDIASGSDEASPAPTDEPIPSPTEEPTTAPTTSPPVPATVSPPDNFSPCSTSGQYWDAASNACRGPRYVGECYNPSTSLFQNGCAPGFTCINNKCSTIPPATFPPDVCYVQCTESDEYCENGTNFCRGPEYAGECFNIATGHFQNGCGPGYQCSSNMCVRA